MNPVSVSPTAPEIVAAYLARDPGGNVELLVSLRHDEDVSCRGAMADDRIVGVLVAGRQWSGGPLTAMIEAEEQDALVALARALPTGTTQLAMHRPWMLPALESAVRLIPVPQNELLVFTATAIALPLTPEVRPLTAADAAIVTASATPWGRDGFADALRRGYRPFGILHEDRVVARAMAAYATEKTEEVSAVWTAPAWRGQGFATAVAVAVAADLLTRVPLATYMVHPNNFASRHVAVKAGFALHHQTTTYHVARR